MTHRIVAILAVVLACSFAAQAEVIYEDGFVAPGWTAGSAVTETSFQGANMLNLTGQYAYFWAQIASGPALTVPVGETVVFEVWNDMDGTDLQVAQIVLAAGSYWSSPSVDGRPDGYSGGDNQPQHIEYGQWEDTTKTTTEAFGDQLGSIQMYIDSAADAYIRKIYVTPEPASMGLLGLGALALLRRRR